MKQDIIKNCKDCQLEILILSCENTTTYHINRHPRRRFRLAMDIVGTLIISTELYPYYLLTKFLVVIRLEQIIAIHAFIKNFICILGAAQVILTDQVVIL